MDGLYFDHMMDDDENDGVPFWVGAQFMDGGEFEFIDHFADVDMDALFFDQYDDEFDDDGFGGWYTDSDYSDNEDHNKIFITLQDSHVLKRMNFHKAVNDGRYRLPRTRTDQHETYESLYRVLDEFETLLKVWKKRSQHAFTAHIQRQADGKAGSDPGEESDRSSIRYGVDYSEGDMEHESDGEENDMPTGPVGAKNEALSKKKYCQSTKVFYDIFDSDRHFDCFLAYIHRVKRHVFSIMFDLFMPSMPAHAGLPSELWEKIWKYTQTPYRENPTMTFNVGLRARKDDPKFTALECDRITDLFGSVGNFHMLAFEILYKHPYITSTPPMMEVDSLDVKDRRTKGSISCVKSMFNRFRKTMEMNFSRFQALEAGFTPEPRLSLTNSCSSQHSSSGGEEDDASPQDDRAAPAAGEPNSEETSATDSCNLIKSIDRGRFNLKSYPLPVTKRDTQSRAWLQENQFFVTGSTFAEAVALLDNEVKEDGQSYLKVIIWNVFKHSLVAIIDTGITILDACCGRNQNSAYQLFTITSNRFAFVKRSVLESRDEFVCYQWKFDADWTEPRNLGVADRIETIKGDLCRNPLFPANDGAAASSSGEAPFADKTIISIKATTLNSGPVFVLNHQNPYNNTQCSLFFYDVETGQKLEEKTITLSDRIVSLECLKGNRAILKDDFCKEFLFVNLETKKIIASYKFTDLCKDADHEHNNSRYMLGCVYEAKMDPCPERNQFVIFSQNMTCYQLFDYSLDEEEDDVPEVIANGTTLVYEMSWRMLSKVCLLDGLLFATPSRDIYLRAPVGDFYRDDIDVYGVDVFAFDLKTSKLHPILSMLQNNDDIAPVHDTVLTNEYSRRHFADVLTHQYPFFSNDRTMMIPMQESYTAIQFQTSARLVNDIDSEELLKEKLEREKAAREKEERKARQREKEKKRKEEEANLIAAKKKEKEDAKSRFANTGEIISGKIAKWQYSYGFITILNNPEAKKLGTIFVHISDFVNRGKRFIKVGQRVSFSISEAPNDKLKATNVQLEPSPQQDESGEKKKSSSPSGSGALKNVASGVAGLSLGGNGATASGPSGIAKKKKKK